MKPSPKAAMVVVFFFALTLGLTWSGGVSTAAAQTIQVTSADPPEGSQGTVNLNVVIKGKGFKTGAMAKFLVTGTNDPGGVKVNSTTFRGSTELLANIDIAETATLSKFDIQVQNRDGRTGKGTELFSVTQKAPSCVVTQQIPTGAYCLSGVPGMPGCLDTSFGNGTGRVMTPPNTYFTGVALQNVGNTTKIIAVGNTKETCGGGAYGGVWTVARYNSDGTFDTSFGSGGTVQENFQKGTAVAHAVVVQPADGKIVVAGYAPSGKQSDARFAVARYNVDGSRDASFGGNGLVFPNQAAKEALTVAIQPDGKIVAAGCYTWPCRLAVVRLNVNGTTDTSFNGSGIYVQPLPNSEGLSITMQTVGLEEMALVSGWNTNAAGSRRAALWRFRANGTLDTSFGSSGVLLVDSGSNFDAVAIDADHRIVAVGGPSSASYSGRFLMARFEESGSLDASFGDGGIVISPVRLEEDSAHAVAIQPDGRILVAGHSGDPFAGPNPPLRKFTVWRFAADGLPDPSFGAIGLVLDGFTSYGDSWGYAMVQQADGKFIVAGYARGVEGTAIYAALARFWR